MKKLLVCFLLLINSWTVALGFDSDWLLVRKQENVKVWLYSRDKAVTGSVLVSRKAKENVSVSSEQKKYFQLVEQQKKATLSYLGITDWKAINYAWNQKESHYELTVVGTYKDALGNIVKFYEIHEFRKNMTLQILITQPEDSKISSDVTNRFIKYARAEFESQ